MDELAGEPEKNRGEIFKGVTLENEWIFMSSIKKYHDNQWMDLIFGVDTCGTRNKRIVQIVLAAPEADCSDVTDHTGFLATNVVIPKPVNNEISLKYFVFVKKIRITIQCAKIIINREPNPHPLLVGEYV